MAAKTDAQLDRLAALKAAPSLAEAREAIEKALRGKNSLVAGKAAAIVEAAKRYKLLVGDREPAVIAECLPAAIALTRSLEPVVPFLDSDDEGLREAAILAVGESRLPGAFELLRDRWDGELNPEARKLLAMSIGLTRDPAGVEFLIQQVEQADARSACVAVEALALYRHDDAVRERVRNFGENRGGAVLDVVRKHLSG